MTGYRIGNRVWVNGYGDCKIKTNRVQRTIIRKCVMSSGAFYKVANGTNTTGRSYHWYSGDSVTLVNPVKPLLRVRAWAKHSGLIRQSARCRA